MQKLLLIGRIVFGLGMIGLAGLGLGDQDFLIGRPPAWPAEHNPNPLLSYVSNTLLILAVLAVLANRRGYLAAVVIATLIFLLTLTRHLSLFMADWLNTYKTLALIGGSLVVAASFCSQSRTVHRLVWAGSISLALFFIASGYAHFKFFDFVAGFIPAYIPFHEFFAGFTGACLLAGGLGLLIPRVRTWAAIWTGIMLAGWFLLLHIPRFLADPANASDRMGLCESFTLAGICWVLAGVSAGQRLRSPHPTS